MQHCGYLEEFIGSFNWSSDDEARRACELVHCLEDHLDGPCPGADSEYLRVSHLLASNPLTPAQVLDHMSRYVTHPQVLERVAGNSNSTRSTLNQLSRHQSPLVRGAVAEGQHLDIETLWLLARDEHTDVRFTLAENHSVPIEILDELSGDENPYVAHRAQMTRKRISTEGSRVEELPAAPASRIRRIS